MEQKIPLHFAKIANHFEKPNKKIVSTPLIVNAENLVAKLFHKRRALFADMDMRHAVLFIQENDGTVEHYGDLVLKFLDAMDPFQLYFVKGRIFRYGMKHQPAVVERDRQRIFNLLEKDVDVQVVRICRRLWASFINRVYYFLRYHTVLITHKNRLKFDRNKKKRALK